MGVRRARWARRFGWDRIAGETLDVYGSTGSTPAQSATRMMSMTGLEVACEAVGAAVPGSRRSTAR